MSTASVCLSSDIDCMYKSAYINRANRVSPRAFDALRSIAIKTTSIAIAAIFSYPLCVALPAIRGLNFTATYLAAVSLLQVVFDAAIRRLNDESGWFDIRAAALILEPKDSSVSHSLFSSFSPYHYLKSTIENLGGDLATSGQREVRVPDQIALVIGMNYERLRGGQYKLQNCHNDALHVIELASRTGSKPEDITLMLDLPANAGKENFPSKINIVKRLRGAIADANLAAKSNPEIVLLVHDSGHGVRTPEKIKGSEEDGMDDSILAADFEFLSDDELKKIIKELDPKASALFTFDCCHSGSMLDLPNCYSFDVQSGKDQIKAAERGSEMDYGSVILISGCLEAQTSADGGSVKGRGAGAMTAAYYSTIEENNYHLTWRQLLLGMNQKIRARGLKQNPQISSSRKLNLDSYVVTSTSRFQPQIK